MLDSATIFFLGCLIPAFVISFGATAWMRKLAPRLGLIDRPAARKVHTTPTPLGGGIGIWLGVVLPLIGVQLLAYLYQKGTLAGLRLPQELTVHFDGIGFRGPQLWAILAGGTILSIMGLLDDLKNLRWWPRLIMQILVATGLVMSGVKVTLLLNYPWIGNVVTILWLLVLMNSFNFLDNMDGLSSGIALIAALGFVIVMLTGTSEPRWLVGGVLLILAGSIAGFLCHNWPPARIFMGDTGSHFIGLMLASMTVLGTFYEYKPQTEHHILAPLCILAIPLYDFCSVIVIRLSQGRSPFHADKSHFSHRLVELGLKPKYAVLTIYLATMTTGLAGLLLYRVPDWPSALLLMALVTCVLAIIAILETVGRHRS
ncbi:MAG: MraY family glycosyltransferase [Planctomycetaceae bacterium]